MAAQVALQRCPILPPRASSYAANLTGKQLTFVDVKPSGDDSTAYQTDFTDFTAIVSFQLLRRLLGSHSFSTSLGVR